MHLEEYRNISFSNRTNIFQVYMVENTCFQIQAKLYLKMTKNCGPTVIRTTQEGAFICVSVPLTFWCRWIEADIHFGTAGQ